MRQVGASRRDRRRSIRRTIRLWAQGWARPARSSANPRRPGWPVS